ncbi:hypothetical protein HPB50_023610 [Hyalomma asiaticum]|uniref:Uncharacterized protein n=1 Tax=Hyalomma asiaticum TaxID=266040 RepID=A0ACB7T6M7_HYAAI|nr:hypothetical protein HPB50_023610 [Hyalomma asiaticum]
MPLLSMDKAYDDEVPTQRCLAEFYADAPPGVAPDERRIATVHAVVMGQPTPGACSSPRTSRWPHLPEPAGHYGRAALNPCTLATLAVCIQSMLDDSAWQHVVLGFWASFLEGPFTTALRDQLLVKFSKNFENCEKVAQGESVEGQGRLLSWLGVENNFLSLPRTTSSTSGMRCVARCPELVAAGLCPGRAAGRHCHGVHGIVYHGTVGQRKASEAFALRSDGGGRDSAARYTKGGTGIRERTEPNGESATACACDPAADGQGIYVRGSLCPGQRRGIQSARMQRYAGGTIQRNLSRRIGELSPLQTRIEATVAASLLRSLKACLRADRAGLPLSLL